jgi:hypothetical protein
LAVKRSGIEETGAIKPALSNKVAILLRSGRPELVEAPKAHSSGTNRVERDSLPTAAHRAASDDAGKKTAQGAARSNCVFFALSFSVARRGFNGRLTRNRLDPVPPSAAT